MMPVNLIARRATLPCEVPLGGVAVLLEDGQIVGEDALRGPGPLRPRRRRQSGRQEAIVLFTTTPTVRLNFDGLSTAEGNELRLSLKLALEIAAPLRFVCQVVGGRGQIGEADLADLLHDAARSGLAYELRQRSLADWRSRRPADWGAAVEACLRGEVDLLGPNGLRFVGIEAFDLQELGVRRRPLAGQETGQERREGEETDQGRREREEAGWEREERREAGQEPEELGEVSRGPSQEPEAGRPPPEAR